MVLGTDTGVGKTRVSCAFLHGLRQRGLHALGMKPVATGVEDDGENSDVRALKLASSSGIKETGLPVPTQWMNPYSFEPAVAPHLAARRVGVTISFACLRQAFHQLQGCTDAVVVEGAGGVLVPLSEEGDMVDLALALDIPVVLVVGLRLGCLNHALLSAEALQSRSVPWAGWVANRLEPDLAEEEGQLETLRVRLPLPFLGVYPHAATPESGASVLDWETLLAVGENRK